MGGLARKASIIKEEQKKENNVLVFDTGDTFFLENNKYDNDTRKIHAEIIAKSYNMIGCNSLCPGLRDISEFGASYLDNLKGIGAIGFSSCNIYDSTKTNRIFDQYSVVDMNGFKVAYIGASSVFKSSEVHIKEPLKEIKAATKIALKESDFIILLFNGTESDLNRLQASDIDIDMILYSKHNGKTNSQASSNGGKKRIPVFTSGNRGKYLNKITVSLNDANSNLLDISKEENNIRASKKFLDNKSKLKTEEVSLEEFFKNNKKVSEDIARHRLIIKSSEGKIEKAINSFKTEKIPLNGQVESDPEVLKIVEDGMAKIVKGPEGGKDHKGRLPSHPHHGHNH